MEFYEELFLTALISVLIAFLIGKIAAADQPEAAPPSVDLGPAAGPGMGLDPIKEGKSSGDACASGVVVASDPAEAGVIEVEEHAEGLEKGKEVSGFDLDTEVTEVKFSPEVDIARVDEVEIGIIGDDLVKGEERFVEDEAGVEKEAKSVVELDREDARAVSEEKGGSLLHGEDEWEGVERSELEKLFGVATEFVGSGEGEDAVSELSNEVQMQLCGLHKVATEGPCYEPQPMAFKVSARAKWHAWQRLGNMNPEAAMEQYISLLTESIPGWMAEKSREEAKGHDGNDPPVAEVSGIGQHDSKSSSRCTPETESRIMP